MDAKRSHDHATGGVAAVFQIERRASSCGPRRHDRRIAIDAGTRACRVDAIFLRSISARASASSSISST
jgi:hypothetical protein